MEESIRNSRPAARASGLVVRELPEEVLVYDLERHKAICLNRTAALVWKRCDGRTSVGEMSRLLTKELGAPVGEELVWLALDGLGHDHLLEGKPVARPATLAGMSRREMMRRLGIAAAVALPLVSSIVAPTAAEAASCLPTNAGCTTSAQCCSGVCAGGVCA